MSNDQNPSIVLTWTCDLHHKVTDAATFQQLVRQERQSKLGERLQQIREKIVATGTPLLTDDEIDRELMERRGGYHESE